MMKEKYERVYQIKDKAISLVESQLNGDLTRVDAKELGEVADIAKDMAELAMYCEKAEYYHTVVDAMKHSSEEYKYYTPTYNYYQYDNKRPMDSEWDRSRMYYSSNNGTQRDMREGRSGITRRTYMDMKGSDENGRFEIFKKYIDDVKDDFEEMFIDGKATQKEKEYAKQSLAQYISKI